LYQKLVSTCLLYLLAGSANAVVLGFDDIGVNNSYRDVASYQGFDFSMNLDVIDIGPGSNWSDTGPAVSGDFAVLNNNGGTGIITRTDGGNFSFQNLFARTWFTGNQGSGKSIVGFRNGVAVASVGFSLNTNWIQVTGNFNNIDALELRLGDYFLVDDISLTAVPEPSTWLLLGLGLLTLGFAVRRRA
jgi:hypothetical protein